MSLEKILSGQDRIWVGLNEEGLMLPRFHCIYWPAFLMALDIPLPKRILTHAHWTLGREKMSKSTGNAVNPFFALERFGVDTMRYFLALRGNIDNDAAYDNQFIIDIYKSDLQCMLGNLSSRIIRAKGWNVRRAVNCHFKLDHEDAQSHRELLQDLPEIVAAHMERDHSCSAALAAIMDVIRKVCNPQPQPQPHPNPAALTDKQIPANLRAMEHLSSAFERDAPAPARRHHLPRRRIPPNLLHLAAALHAVQNEVHARPARRPSNEALVRSRAEARLDVWETGC